ncbi:MAG: T9SS type A sorting domain-containing protein [Saprospiraceae bacterium]|nr:T9SS type A sorting domain-containing protein [Saprospiraceae bacterium]
MKNQIFCLIVANYLFISSLNAQSWGDEGAHWWYDTYGYGYWGYIEMFVDGDTIVNEQSCNILRKKIKEYHFAYGISEGFLQPDYFYEADSIIYLFLKQAQEFDTLYNFNASIGAVWETPLYFPEGKLTTEVLTKGSKKINEVILNWQLLEYKLEAEFYTQSITDTVYNKIGNTHLYFRPWDYFARQLDGGEGGYLRCYEDNKIGNVRFSLEDIPCDFVTATNDNIVDDFIQISPNPFTNYIKIDFPKAVTSNFEIIISSIEGRIIKRVKLPGDVKKFEITTTDIQAGYYLLRLSEQGILNHATKIIKF